MDTQTSDGKKICIGLPTLAKINMTNIAHGIGASLLILVAGLSANPDIVKEYAGTLDVSLVIGALGSLGAFAYNFKNQADAKNAVAKAASLPPVDPATNQITPEHTGAVLVKQYLDANLPEKAKKVIDILHDVENQVNKIEDFSQRKAAPIQVEGVQH